MDQEFSRDFGTCLLDFKRSHLLRQAVVERAAECGSAVEMAVAVELAVVAELAVMAELAGELVAATDGAGDRESNCIGSTSALCRWRTLRLGTGSKLLPVEQLAGAAELPVAAGLCGRDSVSRAMNAAASSLSIASAQSSATSHPCSSSRASRSSITCSWLSQYSIVQYSMLRRA